MKRGALDIYGRKDREVAANYQLRPATKADYRYCYLLMKRNMYDLFCRHMGGWVPSKFREGFVLDEISIVMMNGKRAGYLNVKRNAGEIYIQNIQLSPALHGRGIGTSILSKLLAKHVHKRIGLRVFVDNPAKRLYQRLGFSVVHRKRGILKMERALNLRGG